MYNYLPMRTSVAHSIGNGRNARRAARSHANLLHRAALLFLLLLLLLARLAPAQVTTATISGVVEDSSGRVVPGASVAIHRLATGARRMVVTDGSGRYLATDLDLGTYEVQAEMSGFQTEVRSGIELTLGREAVVDFTLQVGTVREKVMVTGEAPLVDTANSSMGNVVERQTIADLPLNGRDYTQLTLLVPGVTNVTTFSASSFSGLTRQIAVAGARASSGGVYLLDGTNVMGFWNDGTGNPALGTALGVDAIEEFKVETNNFSPEYGRAGASVVNAVSRSGSNQFHSSVYEYLRNSALDARNFFDPSQKPPFKRNQFGASSGGKIVANKTFYFVDYEGLRQTLGETALGGTPTAQARLGILPSRTVAVNPAIVPLLNLFPLPNGPDLGGGVGELITTASQTTSENYFSGRIDQYLSARDTLFGRVTIDNGQLNDPFPFAGMYIPFYQLSEGRNRYATLQETHVVSPRVVNSFRLSFNRSDSAGNSTSDPPALNLIPGVTGRAAGSVDIGGVGYVGPDVIVPYYLIINDWTAGDDINLVHGRHLMKAGFEWQKIQDPYRADLYSGGSLTFNTLADFLTANPYTFVGPLPGKLDTERTWNQGVGGAYFWDSYRLRKNLTLNFGVRYEFITNPTESHGRFSSLVNLSEPAVTQLPHVFAQNPSLANLAPRFGFAWDATGDGKTSIRGGFGMFYQEYAPRDYAEYGFNPPQTVLGLGIFPGFPISPAALFALPPSISLVTGYRISTTPYVLEYNLNIQRQLAPGLVLEAGGVFSGGRRLLGSYDYNEPLPNAALPDGTPIRTATAMRPNPYFSTLAFSYPMDTSNYRSLVVTLEKKLAGGSRFFAAYTLSHSLDTQSNEFNGDGWNDAGETTDINNLRMDYGNSTFDVRQNLTLNYIYDLPFGHRLHGLGGKLAGGWQFAGITTFHSGLPSSVENGFDRANTQQTLAPPEGSERPDLKPGYSNDPVLGLPNRWFDPNAFELQPAGAFGNLGRDTVTGPGMADVDCGFLKAVRLGERYAVHFRFEMFNILNHANFAVPVYTNREVFLDATGTVNPQAGQITQTVTSSRQLQFALRFSF